jgi:DNA-binding CsgD family transcriptional regulator
MVLAAEAATAAAAAHSRAGNTRQATAWGRAATDAQAVAEGVKTPGVTETVPTTPLSRREREVALLAAEGLTSREIAERLYLSGRTVENHLSRIYDKLGIDGREDLPEVLA